MKKTLPISYSSSPEDDSNAAFLVHTPRGVVEFKPCHKVLHELDMKEGRNAKILCVQVVPTIQRNFEGYSRREIKQAIKAGNFRE